MRYLQAVLKVLAQLNGSDCAAEILERESYVARRRSYNCHAQY